MLNLELANIQYCSVFQFQNLLATLPQMYLKSMIGL